VAETRYIIVDAGRLAMASTRAATNKKTAADATVRHKKTGVSRKRFKDASGKLAHITVLDANAATFGADLLQVFKDNVAKARKENKRLFGSPDRVPGSK
jgi:hypothetical protein